MPHGEGYIMGSDGLKHSSKWIMGIDSEVLWYFVFMSIRWLNFINYDEMMEIGWLFILI